MSYYAVHIPMVQDAEISNDKIHVFTSKEEALDMLKSHKEARLKIFKTNEDAVNFAQNGFDLTIFNMNQSTSKAQPIMPPNKSPFRFPKSQELVIFRKLIEDRKNCEVEKVIRDNPRYLIGSGDTPSILKESVRYNALHVAALSNNAEACEIILEKIGDPEYIQYAQNGTDSRTSEEISNILLDLYLNMPEKGRGETPLHLAVKFGFADVVEVLISYPQCSITANTHKQYPKDIICQRVNPRQVNPFDTFKRISCLLEEQFYVPVIRSADNSMPPVIGEPFSTTNPPALMCDPLSPKMEIKAYAGPMNKEQAIGFRRRWKTPPRGGVSSPNNSIDSSPSRTQGIWSPNPTNSSISSTPKSVEKRGVRQLFPNKNFEQNIQNNNHTDLNSQTKEIEAFFNDEEEVKNNVEDMPNANCNKDNQEPIKSIFVAQSNELFSRYRDKLLALDDSVGSVASRCGQNQSFCDSPLFKERLVDVEKGLEVFGRQLAKDQNVKWKEYWPFLGSFIDISSAEGLEKLEYHLKKINVEKKTPHNNLHNYNNLNNLCNSLNRLKLQEEGRNGNILFKSVKNMEEPIYTCNISFYVCIEKSCQVYAKRTTKTIIQHSNSIISINDTLKAELKRLKSLINSYREDKRFFDVNFAQTHSRFANLIITYLMAENGCNLTQIKDIFNQIKQSTQRLIKNNMLKFELDTSNNELYCLLNFLIYHMDNKDNLISPETLTTEQLCSNVWNLELKCNCSWETEVNRQNRHNKRNLQKLLYSSPNKLLNNDLFSSSNNLSNWRSTVNQYESDEEFLSDSGSENETFYTPPESPSAFNDSDDSFEDCDSNYKNYILGEEPTKTDVDVSNALFDIEIDPEMYPNVYAWKMAIQQHNTEDRNNFPSPSIIVKSSARSKEQLSNELPKKRLMFSPGRKILPFPKYLKPSAFDQRSSSCDSDDGSSTNSANLSFMQVSPISSSSPLSTK